MQHYHLRGEIIAALNDWNLRWNRHVPSERLKYEADPTRLLRIYARLPVV